MLSHKATPSMDLLPPSRPPAKQVTPVNRQKRWATKTRSGCLTCRLRKVKCDETKPECQRCARVGRNCTGLGYFSSPSASSASICTSGCTRSSSTSSSGSTSSSLARNHYTSSQLMSPLHSPSQTPSLDGSAAVRDLMDLVPQIPAFITRSSTAAFEVSLSEYILFRGEELALFLEYMPSRLGYSNTLDSTINCVASALHDLLLPPECRSPIKTITLYAYALKALQAAIEDPTESLSAETLCSTQLLSIYESLARKGSKMSISHTQGMTQLVKVRGPFRFNTEFEKSLLISQTSCITANAAFRARRSFLEDKEWQAAIRAAAMPKPTNIDRSELRISIFDFSVPYSRLVGSTHRIIMDPARHKLLNLRLDTIDDIDLQRQTVTNWLLRYQHILYPPATQTHFKELGVGDSLAIRTGYAVTRTFFHVLWNRLHIALGGAEAISLELTTRDMAMSLLTNPHVQKNAAISSNMKIAFETSAAVVTTTDEWQEYTQTRQGEPVTPHMWQTWLAMTEIRPE